MEDRIRQILGENGVQGESLEEILNLLVEYVTNERGKTGENKQSQVEFLRSLLDSEVLDGVERAKLMAKIISLELG
jgi:hypothetical protein